MAVIDLSRTQNIDQLNKFDIEYQVSQGICDDVIHSGDPDKVERMFSWLSKAAALHNMLFPEDFDDEYEDEYDDEYEEEEGEEFGFELSTTEDKVLRQMIIEQLVNFFESEASAYRSLLN